MRDADEIARGLAAYLSDCWERRVEVGGLRASSAGARRRNLLFEARDATGCASLVITLVPPESMPVLDVSLEAAVLDLARVSGVPVPQVHGVCRDSGWVGAPFFLTAKIEGETVPRRVLRLVAADPALGSRLAAQCGESLARLHATDVGRAPDDLPRPDPTSPAEHALEAVDRLLASLPQPSPVFALGLRWLARHRPPTPERLALLHGDLRNGNLVVEKDGLVGVLDWELSHVGDPMEDPAWTCVRMWRFGNDDLEVGGFGDRRGLRAAYEAAGGVWNSDRFHWWKVLGTLRWGIGLALQAEAYLRGTTPSIVMAASGRRVAELEYDLLRLIEPARSRARGSDLA
ncbi:MAG: phosphotransferase family protein [Myxococcota bacterium]